MKKKILTLCVAILVMVMSAVGVAAAPSNAKTNDTKAEIVSVAETKVARSLDLVDITLEQFKDLELEEDFDFEPVLVTEPDEEGTIRNYWVVKNLKDEVIYKAEEIRVDKFITAKSGLNFRTSPVLFEDSNLNKYKALPYAAKVHTLGVSEDGWTLVEINEKTYFCKDKYLSLEKPKVEVKASIQKNSGAKTQSSYTPGNGTSSLGTYSLTAYCNCSKCCGKWAGGKTASGTTPTQGRTVACNTLPFGTKISINGNVYTVEDTGNMGGNVIDIYFNSHSEALQFGRRSAEVFLVE